MPVIGAFMAIEAIAVVNRLMAEVCRAVAPGENEPQISLNLLTQGTRSFPVAGIAFDLFMTGIHGPPNMEAIIAGGKQQSQTGKARARAYQIGPVLTFTMRCLSSHFSSPQ